MTSVPVRYEESTNVKSNDRFTYREEATLTQLYDAMSTLRAVRRLRTDPIPDDVLERVLQAACWAPTGGNMQPWKVLVVTDAELKAGLQDIYRPEWQRYAAGYMKRFEGRPEELIATQQRIKDAGDYLADHLHEAPAILVFAANPAAMAITDAKLDRISMVGGGSVYPACLLYTSPSPRDS